MPTRATIFCLLLAGVASGCAKLDEPARAALPPSVTGIDQRDLDREICQRRIASATALESLAGAPSYEARRAEILGRAVGEPSIYVEAPAALEARPSGRHPQAWVRGLVRTHAGDKATLRTKLLPDGYVYADDPQLAFALVRELSLDELFDEPEIWLARGDRIERLERQRARFSRGFEYRHTEGRERGRGAELLLGDRLAASEAGLAAPLHRDVRSLRDRVGFERIEVTHRRSETLVAKLRFGGKWVPALIESEGAHLELGCIDADREARAEIDALVAADAPRRRAVAALHVSIGDLVDERLPFDRPRGVTDHLSDGQLRPAWRWAYQRGHHGFSHEGEGYAVFDRDGRPNPPQMCVELILDAYERAAGTWYRDASDKRERVIGGLDFDVYDLHNRAGVLAFEKFAAATPDLFSARRIDESERIPFRDREQFFQYLVEHADDFMPGDIVAIQGPKADGYIHQHAILIEDVDPVTGMPHALTDQMKRPRRRSWEGIMAEAPLRRLLYHVRPTSSMLSKLDRGGDRSAGL
jgi:hypothetical protein